MIAAFDELTECGEENVVPEIGKRDSRAAQIGIEPARYKQAAIPEDQSVFKAIADNKIERTRPSPVLDIQLGGQDGGRERQAGRAPFGKMPEGGGLVRNGVKVLWDVIPAACLLVRRDDGHQTSRWCRVNGEYSAAPADMVGSEVVAQET